MLSLIFVTLLLQTPQPQPPARDAAATAGTGVVRGKIVPPPQDSPLHRVRVTLNGAAQVPPTGVTLNAPAQNVPTGVTDTRGEFEISGVPVGASTLSAVRAGYLTVQYGQRRPREAGRPIVLAAGQSIEKIEIVDAARRRAGRKGPR